MQAALRLLLALSLILNGLSPVWASGAMAHGQHQMATRPTTAAAAAGHLHHAGHDHASMHASAVATESPLTAIEPVPEPEQQRSCCDDPSGCQCGCVLPPAMLLSLRMPALHAVTVAPAPRYVGGLAVAAIGPPFRPPSS
jgi:hypothetical protein